MCTTIQSFANTGAVTISTANPNLNGTGTLGTVLTAMSSASGGKGTLVNLVTIKAIGATTQGMVRLFVNDGVNTVLYKEVYIPAIQPSGTVPAFQITLSEDINLDPGDILYASTERNESFNVVAYGTDWKNCDCIDNGSVSCGSMQYFANTGFGSVSVANSNLDGSGTLGTILTAASGALNGGTMVPYVNIKAIGNTTEGMLRLFIDNGGTNFLIREIPIPATTQTEVQPAYRTEAQLGVFLKAGYSLKASTQNSDIFTLMSFASDWVNCTCLTP